MRVVEPHQFKGVKHPKKRQTRRLLWPAIIISVLGVYVAQSLLLPVQGFAFEPAVIAPIPSEVVELDWPEYGQAAAGAVGYGTFGTHGEQKDLPTASVAKVMTALAVLKKRPLALGEQGPILIMTEADVEEYNRTVAMYGSNVPVVAGQEISQYQALQALLLPSSNNMAHSLVRWAYGSDEEYLAFVNNFAKSLGMTNTNFDDASGYSPKTRSTAADLVKLAVNAMDNPVIREIASQPQADIPVAGRIYNVNMLLGKDGIIGVKTGNTDEAGGCFMAAAKRTINGKDIIAVSVIMGAETLGVALRDSVPLVNSVLDNFEERTLVTKDQIIGTITSVSGAKVEVKADTDITGVTFKGLPSTVVIESTLTDATSTEGSVATARAEFGRTAVTASGSLRGVLTQPAWYHQLKPRFL